MIHQNRRKIVEICKEMNSVHSPESASSPANRPRSADVDNNIRLQNSPESAQGETMTDNNIRLHGFPILLWSDPVDHCVFLRTHLQL